MISLSKTWVVITWEIQCLRGRKICFLNPVDDAFRFKFLASMMEQLSASPSSSSNTCQAMSNVTVGTSMTCKLWIKWNPIENWTYQRMMSNAIWEHFFSLFSVICSTLERSLWSWFNKNWESIKKNQITWPSGALSVGWHSLIGTSDVNFTLRDAKHPSHWAPCNITIRFK